MGLHHILVSGLDKNIATVVSVLPVSNPLPMLHTELCCKSRSIFKGSVIILFLFFHYKLHTHTQPLHEAVCSLKKVHFLSL